MNTSPSTESVRAGQPALDLPRSRSAQAHPRVNRALRCLPERLASNSDDSLKALADVAGLSPSRFMHVFTASVGMPLRRYILNLRLECACRELAAGGTVTSAAFVAGSPMLRTLPERFGRPWEPRQPTTFNAVPGKSDARRCSPPIRAITAVVLAMGSCGWMKYAVPRS